MQRFLFLLTLTLLVGALRPAFAQRAHQAGPRLLEQLDLTEQQRTQLKALRLRHRSQMESLRAQSFPTEAARHQAVRALRRRGKAATETVLTETQRTKLRELAAQRRAERPRVDRQALRSDVKAYRKENIRPVMRTQRAKLELLLSPADKALLTELRPKAKTAKRELREGLRALRAQCAPGERPDRDQLRAQRRALEAKYTTELAQLQTLVERYQLDINRLLAEVADEQDAWKDDLQDMLHEHRGQRPHRRKHARAEERPAHHRGHRGPAHLKNLRHAQFLLLVPAKDQPARPATGTAGRLGVSPNPATDQVMLRYTLAADGPVRIVLKNAEGRQLRTVLDETQAAGAQRLRVDVQQLAAGVYYLYLQHQDTQSAQRFVVGGR